MTFKIIIHYSSDNSIRFLGLFAKSRKSTMGLLCLCVRPSVRPQETTRLPLGGFSIKFDI